MQLKEGYLRVNGPEAVSCCGKRSSTVCPKCQIRLKCAMEDPFLGNELNMKMIDLTSLIAKTICWE
ncbi:MAG: hypothetical protein ISS67_05745 [Desulfobacterales bacterium]|uniref:Uncharacterized protein n=1 Tax=Candidatus Desulfaltia bathyphila TaxID=2841697 RepID=A0A8J6N8D4_9BACT|nr:hypothetical protein [Candidatus Desulfaltia bathyphila]MBL7195272.1 hypothetical protein [Desulfobacterales bacterium]MBL7208008.1 hypothetical protein [Desulfobacterales bacterium]